MYMLPYEEDMEDMNRLETTGIVGGCPEPGGGMMGKYLTQFRLIRHLYDWNKINSEEVGLAKQSVLVKCWEDFAVTVLNMGLQEGDKVRLVCESRNDRYSNKTRGGGWRDDVNFRLWDRTRHSIEVINNRRLR